MIKNKHIICIILLIIFIIFIYNYYNLQIVESYSDPNCIINNSITPTNEDEFEQALGNDGYNCKIISGSQDSSYMQFISLDLVVIFLVMIYLLLNKIVIQSV